jgi:transcription termination factor Rho
MRKSAPKKKAATKAAAPKPVVRKKPASPGKKPEKPEKPGKPERKIRRRTKKQIDAEVARQAEMERKAARTPEAIETPPPEPTSIPPLPDEEDEELVPVPADMEEPSKEPPANASPHELLEGVKRGAYHVSVLNAIGDEDVAALARHARRPPRSGERRSETLYRLLQSPPSKPPVPTTFVEGLLELHPDGYGFLRRPERGYVQHPEDVYVGAGLIRRLHLLPGHWVSGSAKPSRPGERLLALQEVEEINHESPRQLESTQAFETLTVVYPDTRFVLETTPEVVETRVMDIFCPLGRGQRAIITSPPRAGKTVLLQKLADAVAHNSPNVDIVVLLVDERPEEVTNMKRSVRGEVIASTFDKPAANHIRVAELVMEKVKRMVEFGRHVVLLLDSITRLGRAYNNQAGQSGRILTGGLDAKALTKPKRFFGAARNIEDGGSLTIIATALVDTGSRMDDVIFEEFKGTGNMEVVLDRDLANQRIFPAINVPASGTRNEDLLLHPEELRRVNLLRRALSAHSPPGAMEAIIDLMKQYKTNAELLMSLG